MEGHLEEKEEDENRGEPDQNHNGGVITENSSPSHEGTDLLTRPV